MRRHTKRITAVLLSSAMIVTTVWGGTMLKKSSADATVSVVPEKLLSEYDGNITYG